MRDTLVKGFAEGFGSALVVLIGAAFITARLTAQWEIRKKRSELDIGLARDFYRLVGSFKAIAREAGVLGTRPQQAFAEWDKAHVDLLHRAIAAEADMEAVLLTIVSEGAIDEGVGSLDRQRRLNASGLLRAAFRDLREQIQHQDMRQPGFGDPLFWLMNRVEGELSRHVFARAIQTPRNPNSNAPRGNAADYLNLIAYRTADLEAATGRLAPYVAEYFHARAQAREQRRARNVETLFEAGTFDVAASVAALQVGAGSEVAIIISNAKTLLVDLDVAAEALLQAHPALTHVLFIGDHLDTAPQLPGSEQTEIHAVYVKPRGQARVLCKSEDLLPGDLPFKPENALKQARIVPPARGVNLLAWYSDARTNQALRAMAEVTI